MTPHQKIIATMGGFTIMLVVFIAFAFFPLVRGIRKDSAKVYAARQELQRVSLYEDQIQKFEELFRERSQDIEASRNLFIDRTTPIAFIEFLENTSRRAGVSLKMTPTESLKKEEDTWSSIHFELTGKGLYPSVLSFVRQLENAPYLLEFANVMMQRLATGDTDYSIMIKVYTK